MINFLTVNAYPCGIKDLEQLLHYAVVAIKVIQIVAPIALILWGSLDLLKGIVAGDEKKINDAKKPFIQRLISAIILFLVPYIVNFAINSFVTSSDSAMWKECYKASIGS